MKLKFALSLVGFYCCCTTFAATIDLATEGDLALTALDDTATYTNTGAELRTLTVTSTRAVTNGCVISGNVRLVKAGAGLLALSGANTYTGGTLIQQGVLSAVASSAFGTGTIDVGSTTQTSQVRFDAVDGVFANDIHVLASSETYPAIGIWNGSATKSLGRGMQFNGNISADGDLVFKESGAWANAYITGTKNAEAQSAYYSGVYNGTVTAAGTIRLVAVCRHAFKGAVRATKFSLNAGNGSRDTGARGTVYLYSDQNRVETFELNYCWFEAKAENVYNGAVLDWKFANDGENGEDYRGYYRTGNKNQTIAGFAGIVTPENRSAWNRYRVNGGGIWTITGAVDRVSDVYFDSSACGITLNAPGATHTFHQAFAKRAAQCSGAINVVAGTMKVMGVQSFQKVPSLTVGADGEFVLECATNQALKAVANLTVSAGGKFTVGADAVDPLPNASLVVRLETDAVMTLPEGMNVNVSELYVDGVRKNGGVYGGATGRGLAQLTGGGTLTVAPYVGDTTTATWTDATGDHAVENGLNWDPVNPDLTEGSLMATFHPQTPVANVAGALTFKGLILDLPNGMESFTFAKTSEAAKISVIEDQVQFVEPTDGTERTVSFEPPVEFANSQYWQIDASIRGISLGGGYSSPNGNVSLAFVSTNLFELETGDASRFLGALYTTNAAVRPKSGVVPFSVSRPELYINSSFGNTTNQAVLATCGAGNVFTMPVLVRTESSTATVPFLAGEGTTNIFRDVFSTYSDGFSSTGGRVNRSVRYYFATNSYTRFDKPINGDWTPMTFDGPGTVEFMEVLSSGSHVTIGGGTVPITAYFHKSNNQGYCFIVSAKARAIVDVDNAFRPPKDDFRNVQIDGTMEMGATSQRIWGLVGSGRIIGEEGGSVNLHNVQTNTVDITKNPLVTNAVKFDGAIDVLQGSGRFTLRGVSGTTGSLSVTNGLMTLDTVASWTNATSVSVSGSGVLKLARDGQFNGEKVVLNLADNGQIDIPAGVRVHVAELHLDGDVKKAKPGSYGKPGSGASHTDVRLTGGGYIIVNGLGACIIFR